MPALNLEIVSPIGIVFKGNCRLVVVPSAAGDLGIMTGHESVAAVLREGQILIYDDKESLIKSFDVKSGFAEMRDADKLLVLLDS